MPRSLSVRRSWARLNHVGKVGAAKLGHFRPDLEALEDRVLLRVQAVSLADPSLYAMGSWGTLGVTGHALSDDGRYAVFTGEQDNITPGDSNHIDNGTEGVRGNGTGDKSSL